MKATLALFLFVLLCHLSACTAPLKVAEVQPGIGVGGVHLGMPLSQVKNVAGEPRVYKGVQEGVSYDYPSTGISVLAKGEPLHVVRIDIGTGFAHSQVLRDFWGKTKEGIEIGSLRSAVLRVYGPPDSQPLIKGTTIPHEDLLVYRRRGISFLLHMDEVVRMSVFPPEVK